METIEHDERDYWIATAGGFALSGSVVWLAKSPGFGASLAVLGGLLAILPTFHPPRSVAGEEVLRRAGFGLGLLMGVIAIPILVGLWDAAVVLVEIRSEVVLGV